MSTDRILSHSSSRSASPFLLCMQIAASSLVVFSCLGCAESVLPVSGSVVFDGQPVAYGMILFQNKDRSQTEARQINLEIRDGKFAAPEGLGIPAGSYDVSIDIFEGAPPPPATSSSDDSEGGSTSSEPKVIGRWKGTADVQGAEALSFSMDKQSVFNPARSSDGA